MFFFLLLFIVLIVPLLTSRTPLFITAMILIIEFMAMLALTITEGFDGNYISFILGLIVNTVVGIVNYIKRKR